MTQADEFMVALTCWRENRSGGTRGMQSVANVIMNRSKQQTQTPYEVCVMKWQFSSITATGDPQLGVYPKVADVEWIDSQSIATKAAAGTLEDLTHGATSYHASSMTTLPYWVANMVLTAEISGQRFYKEQA